MKFLNYSKVNVLLQTPYKLVTHHEALDLEPCRTMSDFDAEPKGRRVGRYDIVKVENYDSRGGLINAFMFMGHVHVVCHSESMIIPNLDALMETAQEHLRSEQQ